MKQGRLKILYYIIIVYALMAMIWWTYMLYRFNNTTSALQVEITQMKYDDSNKRSEILAKIEDMKARRSKQILGEAIVFGLSIVVGIFLLYRSLRSNIRAGAKQRNFLLSITHELKSPLASINLILETMKKRKLNEQQITSMSDDALSESRRLEELFNKILTASRLDDYYQYHFEERSLSDLVKDQVYQFAKVHDYADVQANIQENITMKYDETAIISIIKNLLENAVKYSPDKKKVDIELSQKRSKIILRVADQGTGISSEDKKRVFDQFFRIGSEDTRKTKGTGLGLYIVNKMVKDHKGHIKILNNSPQGSIFEITFNKNA